MQTFLLSLFIIIPSGILCHEEVHTPDQLETHEQPTALISHPRQTPRVRCIVCSSDPRKEGEACITRPKEFLHDCVTPPNTDFGPYTGCRKIEQWVEYDSNSSDPTASNYHRIIRQCAFLGDLKKPCQKDESFAGRQHVCYCQGDGCNPATSNLYIGFQGLIMTVLCCILNIFKFPVKLFETNTRHGP